MERLTIDEIITHCKRRVRKEEALNGRDFFETELMGHYHMEEYWEHRQVAEYLEELKEYRKAEEQGFLLRLPCKVGSRVYEIVDDCNFGTDCYTKMKCDGCEYRDLHIEPLIMESESTIVLKMQDFGKTIFLTREEAESALAEKGGVE